MALGFFSSHRSKSPRTVLEVSPLQADYNALSAKQRVAMTHEFLADVEVLRKAPRHVWWSNMVDVFFTGEGYNGTSRWCSLFCWENERF